MGLLAGEKRKQKIGIDPNNLTWAKDTSSVGQSMLKKMGWKEGAGLGANEDGRVVPVKASMKCNTTGLGCTAKQADAWIAHVEEFDQILASLNASSSQAENVNSNSNPASGRTSPKEEIEGQRRFYGRFSRGGVKQSRTAEDLKCIFGREKTSTPPVEFSKEETRSEVNNCTKDSNRSEEKSVDKSHGIETVTSTYSVRDYFAQKLKKLKKKKDETESKISQPETVEHDTNGKDSEIQDFNSYVTSACSVKDYFSKKMKLKHAMLTAADFKSSEDTEDYSEKSNSTAIHSLNGDKDGLVDTLEESGQISVSLKKKKKKKKRQNEDLEILETESAVDGSNSTSTEVSSSTGEKRERRKKKKRKIECDDEIHVDNENTSITMNPSLSGIDQKIERKKKKRTGDFEVSDNDFSHDLTSSSEDIVEKKKKKKKRKADNSVEIDDSTPVTDNMDLCSAMEDTMKKKKKKKKSGSS